MAGTGHQDLQRIQLTVAGQVQGVGFRPFVYRLASELRLTGWVLNDARGVSVTKLTDLRKQAREAKVVVRVVRNTLAKRAVEGTDFECIAPALVGPTLLAISLEDPGAAARIFKDFAKQVEAFEVKALAVSGRLMGAEQLDVLASLPTRDQAISMLMSVMQAPIAKFVRTINEVPGKLVRTIAAVRDQKEAA